MRSFQQNDFFLISIKTKTIKNTFNCVIFCIYLFDFHLSPNILEYFKLKRDSFHGQFDVIFSYTITFRYIACVHAQVYIHKYIQIYVKNMFSLKPNICKKHSIHFSLSTYMVFVLFSFSREKRCSYLTSKVNSANSKIIFKIFMFVTFVRCSLSQIY